MLVGFGLRCFSRLSFEVVVEIPQQQYEILVFSCSTTAWLSRTWQWKPPVIQDFIIGG